MSRKNFANNEIIQSDTVTTKNLICTKHDELWVFVDQYLDLLRRVDIRSDNGFMRLFDRLTDYVHNKIKLPKNGGTILDMYHVVCQERVEADD